MNIDRVLRDGARYILGDVDVVYVAAIAAGIGGLIIAHVYTQDGFSAFQRAELDSDEVPRIHFQVVALIRWVDANTVLIYSTRIAQVGVIVENQVYGDTCAVIATDKIAGG